MTKEPSFGGSSDKVSNWKAIDWPKARRDVRRLQLRIAKAIRAGKYGTAKALSWLLTHSRKPGAGPASDRQHSAMTQTTPSV